GKELRLVLAGQFALAALVLEFSGPSAQLGEQPQSLDGDHGLIGEIGEELDLLFTERSNLLSVNGDRADEPILVKHRDNQECSSATQFGGSHEIRIALDPDLVLRPGI